MWPSFAFKAVFALVFQEALQVDHLKHLGDFATVLLDLVCLSLFCFFMSFQTVWSTGCCQTPCANKNLTGLLQLIVSKINVWKCKLIFPTDTLQEKIEITDLKPFFSHTMLMAVNSLVTNILQNSYFWVQQKKEERNSYRFGTSGEWVNDRIFILVWTIPLIPHAVFCFSSKFIWF